MHEDVGVAASISQARTGIGDEGVPSRNAFHDCSSES